MSVANGVGGDVLLELPQLERIVHVPTFVSFTVDNTSGDNILGLSHLTDPNAVLGSIEAFMADPAIWIYASTTGQPTTVFDFSGTKNLVLGGKQLFRAFNGAVSDQEWAAIVQSTSYDSND